jgi:2-polyprenyl-3-methyl-5-hydroxy-6-metoxy-1,4-benzoquinol methylase
MPGPTFPRVLRRLWRESDPASLADRINNATGRPTPHRRLATHAGDYWICGHTGQLARDRFPDDFAAYYDEEWTAMPDGVGRAERKVARLRERLAELEPYRRTGRLFEVGSGLGNLLRAARESGWKPEGNDVSPLAAERAARVSGAAVHAGPIESIDLEDGVYDVVWFDNVFEHVVDPMAVLEKLTRAIRPGGALYLETINGQSLCLHNERGNWHYFAEGHLYVPTLVSMGHYFERTGLRPIRCTTHGYRAGSPDKRRRRSPVTKLYHKLLANTATHTRLGHRVKYLLEKR